MSEHSMTPHEPLKYFVTGDPGRNTNVFGPITDEELRERGYKEPWPGYFEDDPRHPGWTAQDRYLFDHPGPDWRTKPAVIRGKDDLLPRHRPKKGEPMWDDDQLFGTNVDDWNPKPTQTNNVLDTYQETPEQAPNVRHLLETTQPKQRSSGFWICRICRDKLALWPHEIAWRRMILGIYFTVVLRSPLVCTNCRIMRQEQLNVLADQDYRPFWRAVHAVVTGTDYAAQGPWVTRLLRWRRRLTQR